MASTSGGGKRGRGGGGDHGDYKRSTQMEVDPWEEQLQQGTSQREDETKWRGTIGLRIPLIANYYKPHRITPCTIIEYRVQLIHGAREERECTVRKRCRRYFWRAVFDPAYRHIFLSQNQLVYDDHAALFSAEPLRNPDTGRPMVDEESFVLRYQYQEEERAIPIMLTIQRTNSVYIGPPLSQRALQFLTLLTTQFARRPVFDAQLNFVPRAQTWFGESNRIYVLPYQGGPMWPITPAVALLRGLRCAMKLDQNGLPIFNVSLVHSLFARANFSLLDVYATLRGVEPLTEAEKEAGGDWSLDRLQALQLETELRGVDLRATYGPKRDYKLLSIDRGNPGERRFRTAELGDVSVPQYYRVRYGITLKFPCLPLFRMRPEDKNIYIPMELLTISGEIKRIVRKLQPSFIERVLQATTMPPRDHFQAIENLAARADVMTSATENSFGVSFGPPEQIQMMRVNGRVLPYPDCMFTLDIRKMAEQPVPDATTKPVLIGLVPVGGISPRTCRQGLGLLTVSAYIAFRDAVQHLMTMCRGRGIEFREANPRHFPYNDTAPYNSLNEFLTDVSNKVFYEPGPDPQRPRRRSPNTFAENEISFLLVFCVRDENTDLYGKVKTYCEMEELRFGLVTQFILEKTLRKMTKPDGSRGHPGTIGNLVLKLNGKLGGVNNRILQESCNHGETSPRWRKFVNDQDPTLFIGVDVTHPSSDEPTLESVAAIAANIDFHSTRFAGNIAIQRRQRPEIPHGENVEQVENLESMAFDAILAFSKETRQMPKHIVVLRDGVSDSQMEATSNIELGLIGDACRRFRDTFNKPNFRPTTSYVVVQKRNPTRVIPANPGFLERFQGQYYGRNTTGNVPPGTVVDEDVTTNQYPNFYLCSHKGQLGTSRIAHYTIVHNTWDALKMDDWQVSMFMLCHLIARSITPVSVPAPVYYADLLCGRARKHIAAMKEMYDDAFNPDMVQIIDYLRKEQFFI